MKDLDDEEFKNENGVRRPLTPAPAVTGQASADHRLPHGYFTTDTPEGYHPAEGSLPGRAPSAQPTPPANTPEVPSNGARTPAPIIVTSDLDAMETSWRPTYRTPPADSPGIRVREGAALQELPVPGGSRTPVALVGPDGKPVPIPNVTVDSEGKIQVDTTNRATGGARVGSAVGGFSVAASGYGLYHQLTGQQRQMDLTAGGAQADWANASLSLNATGFVTGTMATAAPAIQALRAADDVANAARLSSSLTSASRTLGNASGIITIAAGAADYMTAREAGDGYRAGRVAGGTMGAIAGASTGASAGIIAGAFFPPAEVVTIPVGTVIGGVTGAFAGAEMGEAAFGEQLQKEFDERTQQRIDGLQIRATELASDETVNRFTAGDPTLQNYTKALAGYQTAATVALASPGGESTTRLLEARDSLASATRQARDLPSLNYEEWQQMHELKTEVRSLYNREASRIVPEQDTAAEQKRQDNLTALAGSYNRLEIVTTLDTANSNVRVRSPEYLNHANELTSNHRLSDHITNEINSTGSTHPSNYVALEDSNRRLTQIEQRMEKMSEGGRHAANAMTLTETDNPLFPIPQQPSYTNPLNQFRPQQTNPLLEWQNRQTAPDLLGRDRPPAVGTDASTAMDRPTDLEKAAEQARSQTTRLAEAGMHDAQKRRHEEEAKKSPEDEAKKLQERKVELADNGRDTPDKPNTAHDKQQRQSERENTAGRTA